MRESLWASARPVAWWCDVLLRVDAARVRCEYRIAKEIADQSFRTPDAGPVVIPEERDEPRAIVREHHLGQLGGLPIGFTAGRWSPCRGLVRAGEHENVAPAVVER